MRPLLLRRACSVAALGLLAVACGGRSPAAAAAAASPGKPKPPTSYQHAPDSLRPYRNYVYVAEVGEFLHEFRVWVHGPGGVRYHNVQVHRDQVLLVETEDWNSRAALPLSLPKVPASGAAAAERVRKHFAPRRADLELRGAFRRAIVRQLTPVTTRGADAVFVETESAMELNRDFSRVSGIWGAGTKTVSGSKTTPAHKTYWAKVPLDDPDADIGPQSMPINAALARGVLRAARDLAHGDPPMGLEAVHEGDSGGFLPERLPKRPLAWSIAVALPDHGVPSMTMQSLCFSVADFLAGRAKASRTFATAGVQFDAEAVLTLHTKLGQSQSPGKVPVRASLQLSLTSSAGHKVVRSYRLVGNALVDPPRSMLYSLTESTVGPKALKDEIITASPSTAPRLRLRPSSGIWLQLGDSSATLACGP